MAKSYTCATEREGGSWRGEWGLGGVNPISFFKQSKQSQPTVNKMKMSKALRRGEVGAVGGFKG